MAATRDEDHTRHRVLIVEDDRDLGPLLLGVLSDAGYQADLVTGPEGARGPYDLVVADYLAPSYAPGRPWPHLDRLRRLGANGDIPVIGCTGHLDALDDEPARLGLAAVAVKPFDLDELLQTIAGVLEARR